MKPFLLPILLFLGPYIFGQTFTEITNTPIENSTPTSGYAGASWVDYDNDGDIDLFVNKDYLFQNDGTGNFTAVTDSGIEGWATGLNNGNSWADIDNDGDLDLALVNNGNNGVYLNNGNGSFSKLTSGEIAINLNAWSAAWADYDNDGFVDLVATHPCGFIGPCQNNWLFKNNGDTSFTAITNSDVSTDQAAYTVANWADFDDDGDMDLFIGSGEVGFNSQDHIYINQLTETGSADLVLTQNGTLFGDYRDGQNWNLIDYDNDGDLDAFVTNYKVDVPNDFYKNNGDGTFTKLTDLDLGVHIASENGSWLANTWGDFNNDGWIDLFLTADFGSPFGNHMYLNNGDGTFVHHFPVFANQVGSRNAVVGDYDNDGDLDLFINATQANLRGLYRNDLFISSEQNWINITLEGTISNRSAIGAKVRVKTIVNGQEMWQRRDISSQSSFCGQNDLRIHFGLGEASSIDSLSIEWPSGLMETYTNVTSNQFLSYIEGQSTSSHDILDDQLTISMFPNPANGNTNLSYQINKANQKVVIKMLDNAYRQISILVNENQPKGNYALPIDTKKWAPGIYFLSIKIGTAYLVKKLIIVKE